jgi:HEPN domain-containing protein
MTGYSSLIQKPGLQRHPTSNDLRAAGVGLKAEPMLLEDVLFHCQKAIEKSFKAFLTFHDRPFRKTHNLEEIGEACLEIDRDLLPIVNEAVPLSEYAWAFRYPGEPELPDVGKAKDGFLIAMQVFQSILERVPQEAHPGKPQ